MCDHVIYSTCFLLPVFTCRGVLPSEFWLLCHRSFRSYKQLLCNNVWESSDRQKQQFNALVFSYGLQYHFVYSRLFYRRIHLFATTQNANVQLHFTLFTVVALQLAVLLLFNRKQDMLYR